MSQLSPIHSCVYGAREQFASVLAGKPLVFETEAAFAVQVIQGSKSLTKTSRENPQSVINAVSNLAAIGISLNPAKKQAYLVPRDGKVCLDIGYMGLLDLAVDSGSIRWGQSKLVHANDVFVMNGIDKEPTHTYSAFAPLKDRGAIVGAYCVVKTPAGDYLTETMMVDEINYIRDRSDSFQAWVRKAISSCPWADDWGEMAKKTVVKRGSKYWPKTDRLDTAIHYLNTDGGEGLNFSPPDEQPEPGDQWVDVGPLIKAAESTKTDADALAFWKASNGLLAKQNKDHAKLKAAVVAHRNALREQGRAAA